MKQFTFPDYSVRLLQFMRRSLEPASLPDAPGFANAPLDREFDELARLLFELQYRFNLPYRRFCQAQGSSPAQVRHWSQIPPIPTSAFQELDLTSLAPSDITTVFHSSGTTGQRPSRHFHDLESLGLYEASALAWFRAQFLSALCPDRADGREPEFPHRWKMLFLTPSPAEAPHSSLACMFESVRRRCGSDDSVFLGRVEAEGTWVLPADELDRELDNCREVKRSVAILGTAFNFVHLLDGAAGRGRRFPLPLGSRVVETGGYKGRSRVLSKLELHSRIAELFGIPQEQIGCEYGMCELSSQAYTSSAQSPGSEVQRRMSDAEGTREVFHFPPWARARVVSPETGREVDSGETGLLQVFDLANARSVLAVQTQDLALRRAHGFELVGRSGLAESRGCSLMSPIHGEQPFSRAQVLASSAR